MDRSENEGENPMMAGAARDEHLRKRRERRRAARKIARENDGFLGGKFLRPLSKVEETRVDAYIRRFYLGIPKGIDSGVYGENKPYIPTFPWREKKNGARAIVDYIQFYIWEVRRGDRFTAYEVHNWFLDMKRRFITPSRMEIAGKLLRYRRDLGIERVPGTEPVVWIGTKRPY